MLSAFSNALVLIIDKVGGLYILIVLARFLLQAARADFYNPLCQAILQVTSPLLNPLRRVIPGWRRLDIASLVLALLLSVAATEVMAYLVAGFWLTPGKVLSWAVVGLANLTLDFYFYAIIVQVVASFIAPFGGHPVLLAISQLLEPFYRLAHRIMPPLGGFDLSPMLLMLAIQVLEIPLRALAVGLGAAPAVVIGL